MPAANPTITRGIRRGPARLGCRATNQRGPTPDGEATGQSDPRLIEGRAQLASVFTPSRGHGPGPHQPVDGRSFASAAGGCSPKLIERHLAVTVGVDMAEPGLAAT